MAEEKRIQGGQSRTSGETLSAGRPTDLPTLSSKEDGGLAPITKDLGFLPIPKRLRYDPKRSVHFGLLMNATFGVASTFSESTSVLRVHWMYLTVSEQSLPIYTTANHS